MEEAPVVKHLDTLKNEILYGQTVTSLTRERHPSVEMEWDGELSPDKPPPVAAYAEVSDLSSPMAGSDGSSQQSGQWLSQGSFLKSEGEQSAIAPSTPPQRSHTLAAPQEGATFHVTSTAYFSRENVRRARRAEIGRDLPEVCSANRVVSPVRAILRPRRAGGATISSFLSPIVNKPDKPAHATPPPPLKFDITDDKSWHDSSDFADSCYYSQPATPATDPPASRPSTSGSVDCRTPPSSMEGRSICCTSTPAFAQSVCRSVKPGGQFAGRSITPAAAPITVIIADRNLPSASVRLQSRTLLGSAAEGRANGTADDHKGEPPTITSINPDLLAHRLCIVTPTEDVERQEYNRSSQHRRPHYSYMHLIQMAISSSPEQKMTLREIYRWIEEKFPFYGHSTNNRWKNSIRHNLSLYNIFVREKLAHMPERKASYWRLRHDVSPKATKANSNTAATASSGMDTDSMETLRASLMNAANFSHFSEPRLNHKKKGPVPLLPKPTPLRTYTLIPIGRPGGNMPSVSPQSLVLPTHAWSATKSSFTGLRERVTHLKRNSVAACSASAAPRKQVRIAPKISDDGRPQPDETAPSEENTEPCMTSRVPNIMRRSTTDSTPGVSGSQPGGLPRPKNFRRRKSSLKDVAPTYTTVENLPSRDPTLLTSTPLTSTPLTSTPLRTDCAANLWLSPLLATPPSGGNDSGFHVGVLSNGTTGEFGCSPILLRGSGSSPDTGSLRSLGMPGLTPLKSVRGGPTGDSSFTQLLDECHLNNIMGNDMDFNFDGFL